MTDRPAYAIGNGFVQHWEGQRLDREECERIRQYLVREIASPAWGPELTEGRKRDLADLQAAMEASFTEQKAERLRTLKTGA